MKINHLSALCLASAMFASNAFASVILTNDRTAFQNSGATQVVSTFEEFSTSGFDYPSDPYSQGGVTYSSTDNLTLGNGTGYTTNGTNMLVNNWWNPVQGSFYEDFSLFGFDAGWSNSDDNGTIITLVTNLSTYVFNVDFDIASSADFYGFIADENEFFTSFNITSNNYYALDAIDNVTVGSLETTSVPEPSTLAIFALGLAGLGMTRRKQQIG